MILNDNGQVSLWEPWLTCFGRQPLKPLLSASQADVLQQGLRPPFNHGDSLLLRAEPVKQPVGALSETLAGTQGSAKAEEGEERLELSASTAVA